ncbi:WD40 repeat domain-containing protein [Candidatus Raskinella chloraquaticus]|uniref:Anaphase-promoting complex subunit 4-like WD40 domain-containing protein n=1 Tax=Candidatus Raskinella chloraquaticus TaxID=1951219 RepID=A0A1W9HUT2_9HYPH|nr:MAG: hypothetical protein A4S15_12350 [Proteobacteria bacterium SG_bin8]
MTASITSSPDQGPRFELGAHVLTAHFIGPLALFATAEGAVAAATPGSGLEGQNQVDQSGLVLAVAASDGKALIVAGERGVVRRVTLKDVSDIAHCSGAWPTALASGPDGAVAVAAGRKLSVWRGGETIFTTQAPSLVQGLAFAPKGFRVAAAHGGGASLWYPGQPAAEPTRLDWKGAHLDVVFSPDGAFLVTSMQENALHGWKLADKAHMRMTGYPGKPRSLAWTVKGKWLATSGADAAILWPFQDKNGPMGKAPKEIAVRGDSKVTRVACHPQVDVVATGYDDGMVLLTRLDDLAEIVAVRPMASAISALAWSADGAMLAWGSDSGFAGIFSARQSV